MLSLIMPKAKKKKRKAKSYKEIMAQILEPRKEKPSLPPKLQGLGGGVPEKVVKI